MNIQNVSTSTVTHKLALSSVAFKGYLKYMYGSYGEGQSLEEFLLDYIAENELSGHVQQVLGDMSGKEPMELKFKVGDKAYYGKNSKYLEILEINKMRSKPYTIKDGEFEIFVKESELTSLSEHVTSDNTPEIQA